MPVNISNVGPSSLPPEQPSTTSNQSSGPASPSPQDLQATIDQGIQQAAQSLDQILGAVTGITAGANPQGGNTSSPQGLESGLQKKDIDVQRAEIHNL